MSGLFVNNSLKRGGHEIISDLQPEERAEAQGQADVAPLTGPDVLALWERVSSHDEIRAILRPDVPVFSSEQRRCGIRIPARIAELLPGFCGIGTGRD
jgi:hypothetical protein